MTSIDAKTEASVSLLNYLTEIGEGLDGAIDLIEKMDLGPLLLNNSLNFSEHYESKLNKKLELQKEKNKFFDKELLYLTETFEKNMIKLLHIKGLYLGLDLYSPVEARISGDIDVLIDVNQLGDALDLLGSIGYSVEYTGEIVNRSFINDELINHSKFHSHIPVLVRTVTNEYGKYFLIKMDLHTRLFNNVETEWHKMQYVLDRAIQRRLDSSPHSIWLLEHHDRLVHLMYHFSKEYIVDTLLFGENNPKIKLLHDIALFIDKYNQIIDWKFLIETANDLKIEFRLLLTSVLVDEVYPGRIPSSFIEALKSHFKLNHQLYKGTTAQIEQAINFSANAILFGDSKEFYRDFVTVLGLKSGVLECKRSDSTSQLNEIGIKLVDKAHTVNNQFGSFVVLDKSNSATSLEATCSLGWNDSSVLMKINVTDYDVMNITDNNSYLGGILIGLGPGSSDLTTGRKSYLKQYYFNPKVDGGLRYWNLKLDIGKENENLNGEGQYPYNYKLTTDAYGYFIEIEIPWPSLGISPVVNSILAFDFKVDFYDLKGNLKKQMAWSNHYDNIWHPEYMGLLKLLD